MGISERLTKQKVEEILKSTLEQGETVQNIEVKDLVMVMKKFIIQSLK